MRAIENEYTARTLKLHHDRDRRCGNRTRDNCSLAAGHRGGNSVRFSPIPKICWKFRKFGIWTLNRMDEGFHIYFNCNIHIVCKYNIIVEFLIVCYFVRPQRFHFVQRPNFCLRLLTVAEAIWSILGVSFTLTVKRSHLRCHRAGSKRNFYILCTTLDWQQSG